MNVSQILQSICERAAFSSDVDGCQRRAILSSTTQLNDWQSTGPSVQGSPWWETDGDLEFKVWRTVFRKYMVRVLAYGYSRTMLIFISESIKSAAKQVDEGDIDSEKLDDGGEK